MGEPLDGGVREADPVPEAGVDVLVREDDVALLRERGDARKAGQVACGVDVARLAPEEVGHPLLKLDVVGSGAVRRPRPGGARAPFGERRPARLDHLGMKREPEVVVARKHDHLLAVQVDGRALLGVHGVVERRVPQAHLGRVVLAATAQDGLLVLQEKGDRHAGPTLRAKGAFANANGGAQRPRKIIAFRSLYASRRSDPDPGQKLPA